MEKVQMSENGDSSSRSSVSHFFSKPKLTGTDMYHVFISFSGADSAWVHQLIRKLEATFPSLKICTHDRNFTAGKTIIENMTECIQSSQKILMVLSPDFVHSRWCLFEANLSMFQDCMSHKVIVPVMLKPCPMPLYFSHLTYLEVEDEQFFEKLCNRLLRNNAKETDDLLVHFQSSILYSGKQLLSLAALNENDEDVSNGVFSDTCVPDSLKAVVKDPEIFKKAIRLLNDTPTDFLNSKWVYICIAICLFLIISSCLMICIISLVICFSVHAFTLECAIQNWFPFLHLPMSFIPVVFVGYKMEYWKKFRLKKVIQNMSRSTGEANVHLAETSVLAGCSSKSSLVFVFASLKECKELFQITFGRDTDLSKCMWEKAITNYSSDYANCMAKKHFPSSDPQPPGHLVNGICFCQYVAMQITQGNWP